MRQVYCIQALQHLLTSTPEFGLNRASQILKQRNVTITGQQFLIYLPLF